MLNGERVVLRPMRPEDAEPIWRAKLDPVTWARTSDRPLVPQRLEAAQAQHAERASATSDAFFAVDVDGELVGQGLLFGVDELTRAAEVGVSLLPEHRGLGYGREVVSVLLRYGFVSRNLRRLHLQTLASNEVAVRAYLSLGFVEEGRLREAAWVEGAWDDMVLMSVLRREWRARQAEG